MSAQVSSILATEGRSQSRYRSQIGDVFGVALRTSLQNCQPRWNDNDIKSQKKKVFPVYQFLTQVDVQYVLVTADI